jgi:hypothetical protein
LSLASKTNDTFKQHLAFTTPPIPEEHDGAKEPIEVENHVPVSTTKPANIPNRPSIPPQVFRSHSQTNIPHPQPRVSGKEERKEDSNSLASSADGKVSALIPNLNIPVNDGTFCISLRWKTTKDIVSHALYQNSTQSSVFSTTSSMMTMVYYIAGKMRVWKISILSQK